jgi:hypothetical protein
MANQSNSGKVGTDPKAAKSVGGKGDFGFAAYDAVNRAHDGMIEGRPAGSAPGYNGDATGDAGVRDTGVGGRGGVPGTDSGGDLDTDIIGFGGRGGLAAKPPHAGEMTAANESDGSSDIFASGGHATGRNTIRTGAHGSARRVHGDSTDHSGQDTSTMNPGSAVTVSSARLNDPGAEGVVSLDESTGDVDQGGEV